MASCLVYVSWREILIRPFIPPTSENAVFEDADQRVYLSATLGHAGELERSFGRPCIARLLLPDGRSPRSGRRFFVFADLADGESRELAKRVTTEAGKALVLATSTDAAINVAEGLNVNGWPIFNKDSIEKNLDAFVHEDHAILALAGRYDGIDLPDDACRLVCLEGLPDWAHLQEQFLASNLRAKVALEERTRTRVVQGAGRATRNPSDHAIVLISGADLTRYLASPVVRQALDPDLQAEIDFGLKNSRGEPIEDLMENTRVFLDQGEAWLEAEPMIAEARRNVDRTEPEGSALLVAAAPHEVEACACAFRGDFIGARDAAQKAAAALAGDGTVRSYRSLWLYLSAVWSFAASGADTNATKTGLGLLAKAHEAAKGTTWLRETDAGAPSDVVGEDADDTPAVRQIAGRLAKKIKQTMISGAVGRMELGLAEVEHKKFEPALTELGELLGAEAYKPHGQGQSDSAWCWDSRIWIAIEAKSEHDPDGEIALRDVRQANTQLKQLAQDRGVSSPSLSAVVIVSPRTQVADKAVTAAEGHVYLVSPAVVRALGEDISRCWDGLFLTCHGHSGHDLEALVRKTMAEHQVLPTQVFERLTAIPIRS